LRSSYAQNYVEEKEEMFSLHLFFHQQKANKLIFFIGQFCPILGGTPILFISTIAKQKYVKIEALTQVNM